MLCYIAKGFSVYTYLVIPCKNNIKSGCNIKAKAIYANRLKNKSCIHMNHVTVQKIVCDLYETSKEMRK